MKKFMVFFAMALFFGIFCGQVYAEDTANVYSLDGRMATIPASEVENWKSVGWYDYFPYNGKEVWASNIYLKYCTTDIYGTPCSSLLTLPQSYNKITIKWYDDTASTQINKYEKDLNTLIFDLNGGEYKMPYGDFLRGNAIYQNFPQIYWSNPKDAYNIPSKDWEKIQNNLIWIGMSETEFLLSQKYRPDRINTYSGIYGTTEQWVYEYSDFDNSYYYFENGILDSWQN